MMMVTVATVMAVKAVMVDQAVYIVVGATAVIIVVEVDA